MNRSSNLTIINHSPLLFIPGLGTFLYKLQYLLFQRGIINSLIMSRKSNSERGRLLKLIDNRSKYILCKSYKFGRILKDLETPIIADFEGPTNLRRLPLETLHEVSWTLILASSITPKTKKSLANFVPKNFPEFDINKRIFS